MSHVVNKNTNQLQGGFTLIELMLAMTFIGVLLLTIALTVIQIGTIYNKGLALKEINQVSRDIAADIRRTTPDAIEVIPAEDFQTNVSGGRLCLGNYSYVWNTAKALQSTDPVLRNGLTRYASDTNKYIRFAKVPDSAQIYCQKSGANFVVPNIRLVDGAATQELLEPGEHNLGINKVTLLTPPTSATNGLTAQTLFTLTYVIGSGDINTMDATQTACKAPGVLGSDISYCNVQEFTIVFRIGNRV